MQVSLEVTQIGVAHVPCGETLKLTKSRIFPKVFRGRTKLFILVIGFYKRLMAKLRCQLFRQLHIFVFIRCIACLLKALHVVAALFNNDQSNITDYNLQ